MRKSILLIVLIAIIISVANSLFAQFPSINLRARINSSPATDTDAVTIYFAPSCTNGYDAGCDVTKNLETDPAYCNIYTVIPGYNLTIDGMPPLTAGRKVFLGFGVNTSGNCTITASVFANFDANTKVYLVDTTSPSGVVKTLLSLGANHSFNFTTSETDMKTRFYLSFILPLSFIAVNTEGSSGGSLKIEPNPVKQTAIIKYKLPYKSYALLKVYDITGKVVATLVNKLIEKGEHELKYDVENLNNGIYYLSLIIDQNHITKKLVILK